MTIELNKFRKNDLVRFGLSQFGTIISTTLAPDYSEEQWYAIRTIDGNEIHLPSSIIKFNENGNRDG